MDVIDEIVENDNIDESLLQQSPEAIDELDDPIVPELPKTIAGQQLFVYLPNASNDNLGLIEGSYKQRMLLTTDKKVLVDIVDGTIQNIYIKQNYSKEITWLKLNDYFKLIQDLINNITSGITTVDKANKDSEGNIITDTYVSIKPQVFTEEQKAQARVNIGAGSAVVAVESVNGKTGAVVLSASDVGALPSDTPLFSGNYNDLTNKPSIPTTASEINALPNTTKYGASINLSIDDTTYVVTIQLKDQDGNNLGNAKSIDLPLESVVVSGSYDSVNKKVILTLKDGSTIDFSVADLVSGLQPTLSDTQLSATNSGITSTKVQTYDAVAQQYLKNASVNSTGDTLTITKQDNTTVEFQGGVGMKLWRYED